MRVTFKKPSTKCACASPGVMVARVFPLSLSLKNMAAEHVALFGSLKVGDSFESFWMCKQK